MLTSICRRFYGEGGNLSWVLKNDLEEIILARANNRREAVETGKNKTKQQDMYWNWHLTQAHNNIGHLNATEMTKTLKKVCDEGDKGKMT